MDCRPSHLVPAHMAAIYAEHVLGIHQPKVGLLNIGEEPGKGNALVKEVYEQLTGGPLNFIGNIEGRDIPRGHADVVICDGFVGNVVLKFAEGLGGALFDMLKEEFTANLAPLWKLNAQAWPRRIRNAWTIQSTAERPLGVKGPVIVSHGSSNAKAIRNAIRVARDAAENNIVATIEAMLAAESK